MPSHRAHQEDRRALVAAFSWSRSSFYAMYAAVDGMLIAIAGVRTWLSPATLIAVSSGGIAGGISGVYTGVTARHDIVTAAYRAKRNSE